MSKKGRRSDKNPTTLAEDAAAGSKRLSQGQKFALCCMVLFLVAVFIASFYQRLSNPSLQVQRAESRQAKSKAERTMPPEMGGNQSMARISELMRKMRENPKDVKILMSMGEEFMGMENYEGAAQLLGRALVVEPANVEVLHMLGMCMFETKKYVEAAGYFDQILALDPNKAEAHFNLGILDKHFLNKPEEAKTHFETVLRLNPNDDDIREKSKEELQDKKPQ